MGRWCQYPIQDTDVKLAAGSLEAQCAVEAERMILETFQAACRTRLDAAAVAVLRRVWIAETVLPVLASDGAGLWQSKKEQYRLLKHVRQSAATAERMAREASRLNVVAEDVAGAFASEVERVRNAERRMKAA